MERFMRENGIFLITMVIVVISFILGLLFGLNGRSAGSLEEIEKQMEASKESSVVEAQSVDEKNEQPSTKKMNVIATAYCPCKTCSDDYGRMTSTGVLATEGRTIAVDPSIIPYGTEVIINGNTYIAEDCGGAIKGNAIDLFFDSHDAALKFGRQLLTIYIKE